MEVVCGGVLPAEILPFNGCKQVLGWEGAWLVALSRLASVFASLLLPRCSGAHHAELSEFPDSSHSHGHGHGAAECSSWSQAGKMWNLLEDWPGPGMHLWAGLAGLGWMANLLRLWAAAESNEKLVD